MAQLLWKTGWQFLIKLNLGLLYDPAITFLGFYPTGWYLFPHENLNLNAAAALLAELEAARRPSVG